MTHNIHRSPIRYQGVMVSSTFEDLSEHRSALIKAIKGQGLTDVAMENDSAKAGVDLIDSSLQMVRDSAAYVAIISHKYGQIPKCSKRNPRNLSITELEFDEAQRLNRPTLLFIMGDKHQVIPGNVETSQRAATSEVYLALAKFHLNQLSNPRQQAQQLSTAKVVNQQASMRSKPTR